MFDPTLRCLRSLAKYLLFSLRVSVVILPVCEVLLPLSSPSHVNIHLFQYLFISIFVYIHCLSHSRAQSQQLCYPRKRSAGAALMLHWSGASGHQRFRSANCMVERS